MRSPAFSRRGPVRKGSRAAAAHLALMLAREVQWPITSTLVPGGMMLRWDDGKERFLFEADEGRPVSEERIRARYGIPADIVLRGTYLAPLKPAAAAAAMLLPISRTLRAKNRLAAAAEILEIAARMLPDSPHAFIERARLSVQRAKTREEDRASFLREASRDYLRALELDPGEESAAVELFEVYQRLKRPQDAERLLETAVAASPRSATLHRLRGRFFAGEADGFQRKWEEQDRISRSLYKPESIRNDAAEKAKRLYAEASDRYARAEEALQRALEIDPSDAGAIWILAVIRYNRNDFPDALQWFDRLRRVSKDPGDAAAAAYWSGVCQELMFKFKEALQCYEDYLAARPDGKLAVQARDGTERVRKQLKPSKPK